MGRVKQVGFETVLMSILEFGFDVNIWEGKKIIC